MSVRRTNNTRITVRLPMDLAGDLWDSARKRGVGTSDIVREALMYYLDEYSDPLKAITGEIHRLRDDIRALREAIDGS